jgi:hypothetical protein
MNFRYIVVVTTWLASCNSSAAELQGQCMRWVDNRLYMATYVSDDGGVGFEPINSRGELQLTGGLGGVVDPSVFREHIVPCPS